MKGTEENYLALLLCIIKKKSVNKALQDMFGAVDHGVKAGPKIETELSKKGQEMRLLRESGVTYKEICEKYGLTLGTVYYYVNRKTRKTEK